jgi:rRNA-processing protein EBP2
MVTKSKLKMALVADKGVDFKKLKQMKLAKKARKEKSAKRMDEWEDLDEDSDEEEAGGVQLEEEGEDNCSGEDRPAKVCHSN